MISRTRFRVGFGGVLVVLVSYLFVVSCSAAPKKQTFQPLYNESDDVISLKEDTFDYTILATSNAWLVEFYNSWCGHCIRYAPFYKRLATNIKGWGPYLKVAAADCSQDYNRELCEFFGLQMVPTLKFFPAFAPKRTNGTGCIGYDSIENMRIAIVEYISNSNLSGIGGRRFNLLQPVENFSDIWQPSKHSYRTTVVIFEQEKSTLGRQVILDMFNQTSLVVRRMLAGKASKYGVSQIPSMYLVDNENGNLTLLAIGDNCTNYVTILKNLINTTVSAQSSPPHTVMKTVETPGDLTSSKSTESFQTSEAPVSPKVFNLSGENYLRVHEQDLESSLHYSLRHEVAMFKFISDEVLLALKKYINVLAKFLPVQKPISLFLNKMNDWLSNQPGPITGDDWLETVNRLQTPAAILPESTTWTGCQGSNSKYRGYPCSLWTTFHTLTVSAYDRIIEKHDKEDVHYSDVKEVLLAVRGYVKFFFGCRECSENFMNRTAHIDEQVQSARSGVLFLWKAHNGANRALADDVTEDPEHPKVQFPTAQQCPFCHSLNSGDSTGSDFNEKEVLVFLQKMYSKHSLIPDSPRLPEKNHNDFDASFHQIYKREVFQRLNRNEKLAKDVGIDGTRLNAISLSGVSPIDISMCVTFYVVCLGFVVIIYLHFVKPRSLRMLSNSCKLPV